MIGDQNWFDSLYRKGRVVSVSDGSCSLKTIVEEKKIFNFKRAGLPFLTPYAYLDFNCKDSSRFELFRELLIKLKAEYSYVKLPLVDNIDLASVAKWQGWETSLRYSYRISGLQNLSNDEIFYTFNGKMRGKIRKAKRMLNVSKNIDLEQFTTTNELTFKRQNIQAPYSSEVVKRHIKAIYRNKVGFTLGAFDRDQNIHSVALITLQNNVAYLHIAGDDPNLRSSGSAIYLIYSALQICRDDFGVDTFDFEGSSIEPIEKVRRNCGGQKHHYFEILWRTRPLRLFT